MTETPADERPPTLLDRMGGVSGLVVGAVPTLAYVIANAMAGLDTAIMVAIGVSVFLIMLRRVRKKSIQPAVSGLLGVVVAALIAFYTDSAEGYFLPGIWASLGMAIVFAVSVVVRRPLVGVIWHLLTSADDAKQVWHTDPVAVRAFDVATLTFVAVFATRFIVQDWLYDAGSAGWLAFARIAMGYPLLALALVVTCWAVRRARGRLDVGMDERREKLAARRSTRAA
jgi:drug/metabolite transporter (DMT)-like permease